MMRVPWPLFPFLISGAGLERPCQEIALLAGETESWSNMSHPDAQSCDYVPLSDTLFTFADAMKVRILNEGIGLVLHDPIGSKGQIRYWRRMVGSEEIRRLRQREE